MPNRYAGRMLEVSVLGKSVMSLAVTFVTVQLFYKYYKSKRKREMLRMSGIIRVTPAELETVASRYHREAEEVGAQVGRLDVMLNDLKSMWEGASSNAFAGQYDELRPSFLEMQNLLTEVGTQLSRAGQALQDADQQIASQIRG